MTISKAEVLYETTKYSIEHQWDVFKHSNTLVSTILATSATLLSLFLGIQIYGFKILEEFELPYQTVLFIIVGGCLFLSILLTILGLAKYILLQIDPIEILAHSRGKSASKIKSETTKTLAFSWFKNQDTISKKNFYNRLAYLFLRIGLVLLPFSFVASGLQI